MQLRHIERRKKLAKVIASGKEPTREKMLLAVGYSGKTAKHKAKEIIESEQVQDELIKLGFTEQHAKARIASIMNAPIVSEMITPDNQLRASELALKVFGSFAPDKLQVSKVIAHITFNNPK